MARTFFTLGDGMRGMMSCVGLVRSTPRISSPRESSSTSSLSAKRSNTTALKQDFAKPTNASHVVWAETHDVRAVALAGPIEAQQTQSNFPQTQMAKHNYHFLTVGLIAAIWTVELLVTHLVHCQAGGEATTRCAAYSVSTQSLKGTVKKSGVFLTISHQDNNFCHLYFAQMLSM
ncbi:hypothetical protein E2C01_012966 [Portunus trituberculatus]|uniref:Uncharacterized protein n=1 Tax=Portunus trituberculatus TaxID=210409 RepID=A0A5B7DG03_PORTR|nr:hypothetical protein [Portunus trituberculatus]